MSLQLTLQASVLVSALAVAACGGSRGDTTAPTPLQDAGRQQGRELPPTGPTSPGNPPPAAPRPNPPAPVPPPSSATCDPGPAHFAVHQPASKELLERARVAAGAATARFLRPNEAVTLEYVGSRLNLGLDAQDIVRVVTCG